MDKYIEGIIYSCDDAQTVMKVKLYLSGNEKVRKQKDKSSKVLESKQFDGSCTYMRLYMIYFKDE